MYAAFATLDIFATKGVEYLIVIGFLAALIPIWLFLSKPASVERARQASRRVVDWVADWFRVPAGVFFHRGHTWAAPAADDVVRVGLDDFARTLVGPANAVVLPVVGTRLEYGERGFELEVDGHHVPLLSPVRGEVVAHNPEVLAHPELLADPYGAGWLMEVRVRHPGSLERNLLSGRLAATWMNDAADGLRARMSGDLGLAMQDGGVPIAGFARELAGDDWPALAAELLLTADDSPGAPAEP